MFNQNILNQLGFGSLPESDKDSLVENAEAELEMRIGNTLGEKITQSEFREFEQITDDAEAAKWLEARIPNYRDIVKQIFADFCAELKADSVKIAA